MVGRCGRLTSQYVSVPDIVEVIRLRYFEFFKRAEPFTGVKIVADRLKISVGEKKDIVSTVHFLGQNKCKW